MKKDFRRIYLIFSFLLTIIIYAFSLPVLAGTRYDPILNAIVVTDYPQNMPCSLPRLMRLDKLYGWNKVNKLPVNDVYQIDCDLIIGTNDGSETFFQIGSAGNPEETLIMNGDLYVYPYFINGENRPDHRHWLVTAKINRLTMGDKDNTKIRPTLKFAPDYTLFTGTHATGKKGFGGQFFAYNSLITAVDPQKGFGKKDKKRSQKVVSILLRGNGIVLINSEISHALGNTCYGMAPGHYKIFQVEGTTFHDYGFIATAGQTFRNCVFSGASQCAIRDYGTFSAKFVKCVFKNNNVNFSARFPVNKNSKKDPELICVDCEINPGKNSDNFQLLRQPKPGDKIPALITKYRTVIQVVDAKDQPVADAEISIQPNSPKMKLPPFPNYKTGVDGKKTVVLTSYIETATYKEKPKVTKFNYTISAENNDRKVSINDFIPDSLDKSVLLKLE